MKVIIIGGVAGGASAAARLRRLNEEAEIIILERGQHISYANCGLPYHIGGVIEDVSQLLLQTPESFKARFNVDVRVLNEAVRIDRVNKTVTVKDLSTGRVYEESYDKLILSPGAKPIRPGIKGLDQEKVFMLRDVADTVRISAFVERTRPRKAAIIGGGYIGIELAENLHNKGLDVTVLEMADHIIAPLDIEMAHIVEDHIRQLGVDLQLGCQASVIEDKGNCMLLSYSKGALDADMVLVCTGVVPENALAVGCGLELGFRGTVAVDDRMLTSDPDIYAVGDVVEIDEFLTKDKRHIPLAGPANKQGRIAADQICGIDSRYKGTQGSTVLKVFDLTVACTGINEATAKRAGLNYDKVYLSAGSHAGYYPGAKALAMKVLFDKSDGRILGAQIIGEEGADKRCDVLAVAIRAGMKSADLTELELCYAPPYSSAKDPVNMAGYVIENILGGKVKNFHWDELHKLDPKEVTLLDVRDRYEFAFGRADGFKNIPLDQLRSRINELDANKKTYVCCRSGLRSYIACRILTAHGIDCYNISGGFSFYEHVVR
ncbi:MAG TPA: FAD-dependent oxidoreductase [Bacillota bacterium]|nr:FAD-dependent oxidoreductase [Bacillota bacterium]